jgi:hypothetical protein
LATYDVNPGQGVAGKDRATLTLKQNFTPVTDGKKHNVYVVSVPKDPKEQKSVAVQWIEFR